MTTIQVFEPAQCGGCGCKADPAQAAFATDFKWATQMGARIERATLDPAAFAGNLALKTFLERSGPEVLPLMLVDGEIVVSGRYPSRAEIAHAAGFEPVAAGAAGNCCSGGRCSG